MLHYQILPLNDLPKLADAWSVIDFFEAVPAQLHGSLLLEMTRRRAVLTQLEDGSMLLLLCFQRRAAILTTDGIERCMPVQPVRNDRAWLLALMPSGAATPLWELPASPIYLGKLSGRHYSIKIGDRTHITAPVATCPWDWAWRPTLGPAYLKIFLERSHAVIQNWLTQNLPYSYFVANENCLRSTIHRTTDNLLRYSHGIYS